MLARHHLVRPRRDELHVGTHLLQLAEVGAAAEDRFVQRLTDVVLAGQVAAAAVRAAVRENLRLVDVETVGRRDVPVGIDDHDLPPVLRAWPVIVSTLAGCEIRG
ncbi:hypothetical protein D3C83_23190 [compost metagenome]